MSRSPLVMPKAASAFSRRAEVFDTTIGWRFTNPIIAGKYGAESMPETAENVAAAYGIDRAAQDGFAFRSQQRASAARHAGFFDDEIVPVEVSDGKQSKGTWVFKNDEPPRPDVTLAALARLPTPFRAGGTVTAGNSSGINDGACALFVASETAAATFGLHPMARVVATATAGVLPSQMGIGPVPAIGKLLARADLTVEEIDWWEIDESFAAQVLAITRALGLADNSERVNPNGGAIALGHPLGMSGARLVLTAARQLQRLGGRFAIAAMSVGLGQGIAMLVERV
jgi:acetyl-CoA acetyltransferase family protein